MDKACGNYGLSFLVQIKSCPKYAGTVFNQLKINYLLSREDRIRTCDPLVPNQVRYRPALLPGRRRNVAAKWWAKVGVLVGIAARDWETVLEGAKDWMGKQPVGRGNR